MTLMPMTLSCSQRIEKAFERTQLIISLKVPFLSVFSHILEPQNRVKSATMPTHATDSKKYYYNEEFTKDLTPGQFIFINLHEIYHVMLNHMVRGAGKNHKLYNIAADLKINSHLEVEMEHYATLAGGMLKLERPSNLLLPRTDIS